MTAKKTTVKKNPETVDQPTERAPGGEVIGVNAPEQVQFGKEVPYATATRFEIEGKGKGPVEGYYFKGSDAEQQAKDYVEAHPVDGSYWTISTGSTAEALDPVDAD